MRRFIKAGVNFYLDSKSAYFIRFLAIILVLNSHTDIYGNPYGFGGQIGNGLFFVLAGKFFKENYNSILKICTLYFILNIFSLLLSFFSESVYPRIISLWFINALIIYYLVDYFAKKFKFKFTPIIMLTLMLIYMISLYYNDFNNIERVFSHKLIFYSIFYILGKKLKKDFSFNIFLYIGVILYIPAALNEIGNYSDVIQQISSVAVVLFIIKIISINLDSWLNKVYPQKIIKVLSLLSLDIYFWQVFLIIHQERLNLNITLFLLLVLIFSIISNWFTKITLRYLQI